MPYTAMPGMLIMQVSQVGVVLLILLAAAAAQVKPPQAKPGCTDRCGNLTIPYPFGIGPDCYMTDMFSVKCNTSTGLVTGSSASWINYFVPITNISLVDGEIQILTFRALDCYNKSGLSARNVPWLFVQPYTISHTKNKFVAIGCDTSALFTGYRADEQRYRTGCMSICDNFDSVENSCSGIGCCETKIPSGLKNRSIELSSYYNHSSVLEFNPCSYAFIVEKDKFTFSPNTSFEELSKTEFLPMVLNWEIGGGACEEAEKRADYACKGNSKCVNRTVDNEKYGYVCQCQAGYEGNPYLQDGCQDIDECSGSNPCINGTCKNTAGSYSCLCNKGFRNDEKNERICIPKNTKNGSKLTVVLIISLGTGGSLVLLFVTIAAWYLHKAIMKRKNRIRKEKFFKQNGGLLLEQQSSSSEANVEKTRLFNSRELEKATDRFNVDRVLGQGGQGTVYKGMLTDGRIVAVKKSKTVTEGEVGQFINEIVILSQINHRNVVRLLGCCLETEVPLLVYEFLPNGTLSHYIQHQDEEFPLTWEARLRVAIEVAGALSYLHSAASFPIYHRDIKTTNILLDEKYRAKVADFGTSKSVSIDQTHLTTQVAGTFGYLDPEYFQSSQLTDKSDVYSFGVVLVELLTGEKPVSLTRSQESRSLAAYFLLSMENSRLFEILDPQVTKGGTKEEIMGVANVAQRCLNLKGKKRPTMKVVAAELESLRLPPIKDSIVQKNSAEDENLSTHEMTTKDCNDDSTSTWYCTSSGTCTGSSLDVHPLLFFNTQ